MASHYSCDKCGKSVPIGADRIRISIYLEYDLCNYHHVQAAEMIRKWVKNEH